MIWWLIDPRKVISEIEKEYAQQIRKKYGQEIPEFKAGDKIRITKYISLQKEKFEEVTGTVLARYGRGGGSLNASFVIRNRIMGEGFEMTFPLYSPFIKKIEIVEPSVFNRNKLYYLRKKDPSLYMV